MRELILSQAPARICLFGDHQDYLKLPVIATSIDRILEIKGSENGTEEFIIQKKDLKTKQVISIHSGKESIPSGDFLRMGLKVLSSYGCIPSQGYDIIIEGNIPINSGLSSSTAVVVAWIQFLIEAFGVEAEITPAWIAQRAYEVEVLEFNTAGGSMDQYSIAVGGLIYLETVNNSFSKLALPSVQFVIGVSGVAKDTFGSLSFLKKQTLKAVEQVKKTLPFFEIKEAKKNDLKKYLKHVNADLKPFLTAAILNHNITLHARSEFYKSNPNPIVLGNLMNQHHEQLQKNLKLTPPRIDAMIEAVLKVGVCGAKIVGSGGGGCIVAMTVKNNTDELINALLEAGAVDAFVTAPASGSSSKKINQ